jgi:proteic killer suppression protein
MIHDFQDNETRSILEGRVAKSLPSEIQNTARRKLRYLNEAVDIGDLRAPPGNRLEKLSGDRDRQYSIRINDQWRICFRWEDDRAHDVEIVDYH